AGLTGGAYRQAKQAGEDLRVAKPGAGRMGVAARRQRRCDRCVSACNAGRMRTAARAGEPAGIDRAVAKADQLIELLRLRQLRRAPQCRNGKADTLQTHHPHDPLTRLQRHPFDQAISGERKVLWQTSHSLGKTPAAVATVALGYWTLTV